jgi:hypothetical protein
MLRRSGAEAQQQNRPYDVCRSRLSAGSSAGQAVLTVSRVLPMTSLACGNLSGYQKCMTLLWQIFLEVGPVVAHFRAYLRQVDSVSSAWRRRLCPSRHRRRPSSAPLKYPHVWEGHVLPLTTSGFFVLVRGTRDPNTMFPSLFLRGTPNFPPTLRRFVCQKELRLLCA